MMATTALSALACMSAADMLLSWLRAARCGSSGAAMPRPGAAAEMLLMRGYQYCAYAPPSSTDWVAV
jgi:hypothetical protein